MLYKIYDIQMQEYHKTEQTGMPVVIDIDEESLEKFGQWPWPRYQIAELLEKIKAAGVLAVGLDILFAEPDRTSLSNINKSMEKYFNNRLGRDLPVISKNVPHQMLDNDLVLAKTLSSGGFVLGYAFDFEKQSTAEDIKGVKPLNAAVISKQGAKPISSVLLSPSGVVPPLEVLTGKNVNTGFFNTTQDYDGILRKTPMIMHHNDKLYPSLSLATLLAALGNPQVAIKVDHVGIESMRIGNFKIPVDERGDVHVHFRGGGKTFETISAAAFLEDKIAPASLARRIAFVGTSAAGLKDLRATPLDHEYMGVQVHATVIDNVLKNDFITWPQWFRAVEIIMVIIFGIFTTLAIVWARPIMTLAFTIGIAIALWQGSVYAFVNKNMFLSPLYSFIMLGANFSILSLLKYYFSEKDRLFLKKAFANYVADDLIEDIVKDPGMLKLGGQVKTATVLFCDLANFTNISEARTPHEIVDIMSQYFEEMTQYVFRYKGALKEYIGDELMALYGAPLSTKDHAINACKAALDMQTFLSNLREKGGMDGLPPLSARVGVNTGEMLIGNIGSKYRFSYGAMGDNVNLGSRLEGLNKIYGTQIIIGQNTAEHAKDHFHLRLLGAVKVKGKQIPERVYELIADKNTQLEDDHKTALDCYESGYEYYKKQDWPNAIKYFEKGQSLWNKDISFQVMIQRCKLYQTLPYDEGFDGTFIERRK